jgi:hypothetical protein
MDGADRYRCAHSGVWSKIAGQHKVLAGRKGGQAVWLEQSREVLAGSVERVEGSGRLFRGAGRQHS